MAKVYDEHGNEIKEENKSLRFQLDVALQSDPFDINAFKNILKKENIDELLKLDIDSVDDLEKNILVSQKGKRGCAGETGGKILKC